MNHKSYGGEIHLIIDNVYFKMSLVKVLITHGIINTVRLAYIMLLLYEK